MTPWLAAAAVLAAGLGAGLSLDRSVVALPAWRRVGLSPWATFTRQADLGNGLLLYPVVGVGQVVLSVATAISYTGDRGAVPWSSPVYLAAVLAVTPLLATAKAGPNILKTRHTDDPDSLREAFAGFEHWQALRMVLQVATFGVTIWALAEVLGR
jgi:hypothetical protein